MSEHELAEVRRCIRLIRWELIQKRSRRHKPSRRGRILDTRRSWRSSLAHGGEIIDLSSLGTGKKRRRVVVLCDVSGSMERYIRLLLLFLHTVESSLSQMEVFVFGTRLTRITRELRRSDPDAAILAVASTVQDWAGGTRIGESLHTFNRHWARRVMGREPIVLIISDGWDRGDTELLAREMARLQRSSHRLLWLNPLLGAAHYRPLTQGIQAALPYVDDFLPVHNLSSLQALTETLNQTAETRPPRCGQPLQRLQADSRLHA